MNFDKHLPSEGVMSSGFHGIFRQKTVMYTGDFDENIVTIMESLSLNNNILSFVKYYRFIIHLFHIQRSEQADLRNLGSFCDVRAIAHTLNAISFGLTNSGEIFGMNGI